MQMANTWKVANEMLLQFEILHNLPELPALVESGLISSCVYVLAIKSKAAETFRSQTS